MKIKVNGIRINKTTGCLGNSVPYPTHSSLAYTFVQSLESNNTLLTDGHNRQQCSIFKLYLNRFAARRNTRKKEERHVDKKKTIDRLTEQGVKKNTPIYCILA